MTDSMADAAPSISFNMYRNRAREIITALRKYVPRRQRRQSAVQEDIFFEHDQLEDSTKQIRLVRIKPGPESAIVELELSTWTLEDAPEYHAISYAWGTEECQTLLINNDSFRVRRNCYYALWQARLRYTGYIWIDSLCINQNMLLEKGHQVSMMKEIYLNASWVVACIGAHDDNSEVVIDFGRRLLRAKDDIASAASDTGSSERQLMWNKFYASDEFSTKYLHSLGKGLADLYGRPYFTRLWIQQEVAAGSKAVEFLCGDDSISWEEFGLLVATATSSVPEHDLMFPTRFWSDWLGQEDVGQLAAESLLQAAIGSGDFDQALRLTQGCNYTVSHDRIYAILPLVRPTPGRQPVVVDYSKPAFDLLCDAVGQVSKIESVQLLIQELQVDCSAADMKRLREERCVGAPKAVPASPVTQSVPSDRIRVSAGLVTCCQVSVNTLDKLCASVIPASRNRHRKEMSLSDFPVRIKKLMRHHAESAKPKVLMSTKQPWRNAQDVGLVCGTVQIDDVLVSMGRSLSCANSWFLVVRESNEDKFDIVGQGLFLAGFELQHTWRPMRTEMHLEFTAEDFIALVGQDMVSATEYDFDARVERLVTMPTLAPNGTVTFADVQPDDPPHIVKKFEETRDMLLYDAFGVKVRRDEA